MGRQVLKKSYVKAPKKLDSIKMAKVHVCNVLVLDNPAQFMTKLEFEITFECIEDLPEDLEWKIIYVGSAESEEFDQILDTVYVGPVPEGRHKYVFTADPPNPQKIPVSDVVGVTVILLTCSYRGQEFIRVGYYVSNEYTDPELQETPPEKPDFEKLQRNILASNPRVTRFKINWDNASTSTDNPPSQQETSLQQNQPVQSNEADCEMDQNSNSCNTAGRFARPMESGDNVDRTNGQTNNHSRIPNAEEVENFPPGGRPATTNSLPAFKDQMLEAQSPIKRGLQSSVNIDPSVNNHNSNSRMSDNLMEMDFGS